MAVRISGGGELDGAVFQNAATAELQEQIITALGGVVNATERSNKTRDNQDQDDRTGLEKTLGVAQNVVAGSAKVAGAGLGALVDGTSNLLTGQYELTDMSKVLQDRFNSLGTGSGTVDSAFRALTGGLHGTVKFVTETTGTFRELSGVGGGLEGDLIELRRVAANTRIPLDQFAGLVSTNSEKLIALGGSVDQGTKVFAGFSKNLFDSRAGVELQMLGVGFEETNEYMMDYLSTQRRNDAFLNSSQQEQIRQTQNYIYELDTIARLTGKNRKEIQQEARDRAREGQNQAALRLMEAEGIKGAQAEFEGVDKQLQKLSPAVQETFATMVRLDGAIDATSDAQRGLAANMPVVTDLLSESARAFKSGDFEESERLRKQAEAQYFKRMGDTDFLRTAALGPQAGAVGESAAQLLGASQDMLDSVEGQRQALIESGNASATHADALAAATQNIREQQQRVQQSEIMGSQVMAETIIRDTSAALYNTLDTTLKPQIESLFSDVRGTMTPVDVQDLQGVTDGIAASLGGLQAKIDQLNALAVNPDISDADQAKFASLAKGFEDAIDVIQDPSATAQQKADARASMAAIESASIDAITQARTAGTGTTPAPVTQDVNIFDRIGDYLFGSDDAATSNVNSMDVDTLTAQNLVGLPGRQKGSLGEAGQLFENFGEGTPMMLHGVEAVVTPDQLKGLFQDFMSQMPTMQSDGSSDSRQLKSMIDQMSTQQNQGAMLPNLRNEVRNFASMAQQTAQQNASSMQETAQNAAPELQEASGEVFEMLNNKLTELTAINSKQFRTAERQLKSTKGLSGNIFKGLGV